MGAFSNEELSFSSNFNFASFQDLRFSKQIHDNVHGNVYIDPVCRRLSLSAGCFTLYISVHAYTCAGCLNLEIFAFSFVWLLRAISNVFSVVSHCQKCTPILEEIDNVNGINENSEVF